MLHENDNNNDNSKRGKSDILKLYCISIMCGIVAIYNKEIKLDKDMRSKSLSMSKKVRHRGPDWSGIYTSDNAILAHERLSIVDVKSGKQPILSNNEEIILACPNNNMITFFLDLFIYFQRFKAIFFFFWNCIKRKKEEQDN